MLREPYLQITVKVKYILEVNKEILNVYLVHKDLRNNLESEYRYVISVHPVRRNNTHNTFLIDNKAVFPLPICV